MLVNCKWCNEPLSLERIYGAKTRGYEPSYCSQKCSTNGRQKKFYDNNADLVIARKKKAAKKKKAKTSGTSRKI